MLKPGFGSTHRHTCGATAASEFDELPIVIYDFAESRSGAHTREFFGGWSGKLVCDDYSGYKALFERGVIEMGCMRTRAGSSTICTPITAATFAEELAVLRRALRDRAPGTRKEPQCRRPPTSAQAAFKAHRRIPTGSGLLGNAPSPDGSATTRAIKYGLGRWAALTRYLDDGDLPIDNNHLENRIRPVVMERSLCTSCSSV